MGIQRLEEEMRELDAMSYEELVNHSKGLRNERLLGLLKTSILEELKESMTREEGNKLIDHYSYYYHPYKAMSAKEFRKEMVKVKQSIIKPARWWHLL